MVNESKPLILASSSPRRQAYLQELGLSFRVIPADIDETPLPGEAPVALASRLASAKARAVAERYRTCAGTDAGADIEEADVGALIIAADTVVALGKNLLGKPTSRLDASRMLRMLRGRDHEVHSAISVLDTASERCETVVNTTMVWMRNYSTTEIAAYVKSGDPMDKAGGYAIQHESFDPAMMIGGCLSSVVGLPLEDLRCLLSKAGVEIEVALPAICESQSHFFCCQRKR